MRYERSYLICCDISAVNSEVRRIEAEGGRIVRGSHTVSGNTATFRYFPGERKETT